MSDVDIIRQALTVLHSRLEDEGYAPQVGQPDPGEVFNAALPALDRLEKTIAEARDACRDFYHAWNGSYTEAEDESIDRLCRILGVEQP